MLPCSFVDRGYGVADERLDLNIMRLVAKDRVHKQQNQH
jgi:hypothetical protein